MDTAIGIALLIVCVATLIVVVVFIGFARLWARRVESSRGYHPKLAPAMVQGARSIGLNRIITIEILNPLEVAAAQNKFAGIAGNLAPTMVTKMVYDRACRMLREEMSAEGVEVIVEVQTRSSAPAPEDA